MSGKENGMKVKTNELSGASLDWAVAKCEGRQEPEVVNNFAVAWYTWPNTHYSTDWAQGGPIIEREGIAVWQSAEPQKGKWCSADARWMDLDPDSDEFMAMPDPYHGPTPLIAAMRCYVASKLGDEVEIPEELK
jgi:hypothetical protein